MPTLLRQNRILCALPADEQAEIAPDLHLVALQSGERLKPPVDPRAMNVLFPATTVIGHVAFMKDGSALETMRIGCEGMYGASALLGHSIGGIECRVRSAGHAYQLSRDRFLANVERLPRFRQLVFRYVGAQVALLTQQLCCNTMHPALQRCGTRLLLTADRSGSDHFSLTHEDLATMLGGHRPAATLAARALANAGRIRYRHGHMEIVDRPGLIADSCECYELMNAAVERIFAA